MKETNKKPVWLWLLLCLPIVFIVYFAITLSEGNIDPGSVSAVNVTAPTGESFVFEGGEDIPFYVEMYLEANPLTKPVRDIENETPITVVFKQKTGDISFELYAEANTNGCFYKNKDGAYFSVQQSFAKQLLQRKECAYVYGKAGYTLPVLTFKTGNDELAVLPTEYTWQYKDIAGTAVVDTQTKTAAERQFFSFYSDIGFVLNFAAQPAEHTVTFYDQSGNALNISDPSFLLFANDTQIRVTVDAKWEQSENALGGSATYDFDLLYDVLPELIPPKSSSVTAGDVLRIDFRHLSEQEKVAMNTQLITSDIRVNYGADGSAFALIPISIENTAGEYTLAFEIGSIEKTLTVTVIAPEAKFDTANMDPEKYTLCLQPDYKAKLAALIESFSASTGEPMFSSGSGFSKPAEDGNAMYGFGTELIVNGMPDKYVVNGIDYCFENEEKVKATQRGVVIYAGEDEVYGNMLVIDHGCGIQSHYYGLGTLSKAVGDTVQRDEAIGTAGISGLVYTRNAAKLSTLHFAVTLDGVYLNPNTLFKDGILIE